MFLRDVVEELRYSQDLDNLRRLYPEIDDVQAGVAWELGSNPTVGIPLTVAPDFRVLTTTAVGNTPAFWILYTFDTEKVYLHSIEVAQAQNVE